MNRKNFTTYPPGAVPTTHQHPKNRLAAGAWTEKAGVAEMEEQAAQTNPHTPSDPHHSDQTHTANRPNGETPPAKSSSSHPEQSPRLQ